MRKLIDPQAIRKPDKSGRTRTYIDVICECGRTHRRRRDSVRGRNSIHCGSTCLQPFESTFRRLQKDARCGGRMCSITFEDFQDLIKVSNCCYCGVKIHRFERTHMHRSNPHYLDRIDNSKGYEPGNLVVACSLCNLTRHCRFSHEEFKIIGQAIAEIRKLRNAA